VAHRNRYWPKSSLDLRKLNLLENFKKLLDALKGQITNIDIPLPKLSSDLTFASLKKFEDVLDALVCGWVGIQFLEKKNIKAFGDSSSAIWVPVCHMSPKNQPDLPPESEIEIGNILNDVVEWYAKENSENQKGHANLMMLAKKKYDHFKATGKWNCSLWELRICLVWFHRILHWNGIDESDKADILDLHKRIVELEDKDV
jgi:hypothetical protein